VKNLKHENDVVHVSILMTMKGTVTVIGMLLLVVMMIIIIMVMMVMLMAIKNVLTGEDNSKVGDNNDGENNDGAKY
jgi:hypothetical protein